MYKFSLGLMHPDLGSGWSTLSRHELRSNSLTSTSTSVPEQSGVSPLSLFCADDTETNMLFNDLPRNNTATANTKNVAYRGNCWGWPCFILRACSRHLQMLVSQTTVGLHGDSRVLWLSICERLVQTMSCYPHYIAITFLIVKQR